MNMLPNFMSFLQYISTLGNLFTPIKIEIPIKAFSSSKENFLGILCISGCCLFFFINKGKNCFEFPEALTVKKIARKIILAWSSG